jgi:glycosyltransferase involved in cell wall biosynthesis
MEAMAVGKPVIASRIGGLPEIVTDGETGILVEPGDSDALRTAIATLVNDPALAARMGAAGRDRVSAFHASTIVGEIESVYREVLG